LALTTPFAWVIRTCGEPLSANSTSRKDNE
jgi:hypothetical protein